MQGKAGLLLLVIFSAVHGQQAHQWTQTENRAPLRDFRLRGANGPASNIGGLIAWSTRETFHWERLKRQAVECCSKVLVSATGPAARVQWDRMGLYYATGQTLHGRQVYQHENWTQSIFYIYGEYDGWMLGPRPDENFGGLKNPHDGMCVHSSEDTAAKGWGYYGGPHDTKDPEQAFPHWREDDATLSVRCVPKSVYLDSRKVPDPSRAPMLRRLYRKAGPLIRQANGPPPVRGSLNMEAWLVTARCAGDCRATSLRLRLASGQADILLVGSQSRLRLTNHCFNCHPFWTGRLTSGQSASWSTMVPGPNFHLYVVIVGYTKYVSLNIKVDSVNVLEASSEALNSA